MDDKPLLIQTYSSSSPFTKDLQFHSYKVGVIQLLTQFGKPYTWEATSLLWIYSSLITLSNGIALKIRTNSFTNSPLLLKALTNFF